MNKKLSILLIILFLLLPKLCFAKNQIAINALVEKLNSNFFQVKELLNKINKADLLGSNYSWTRTILLNSAKGYLFTGIFPSWFIWFLHRTVLEHHSYKTMSEGAQALIDLTELKIPEIVTFLQILV